MARPKGSPTINKAVSPPGRKKGALDKQQRTLVSNELAHTIMGVFVALGGTQAMIEWASENRTIYYTQILSRLFPAPQKPDGDDLPLVQISVGESVEIGRRLAFALSKAAFEQGEPVAPAHEIPYSQLADQPLPSRPSWMPSEDEADE